MQHTKMRRQVVPGDVIQYRLTGTQQGHAQVREVYHDLLASGDEWYLTNGNPRWISRDSLTVF